MSKTALSLMLAACALCVSATCFAQITVKQAVEIGKKEVPAGVVTYGTKTEATEYKIYFYDNSTNRNYEIEIDSETGKVKELEITGSNIVGSTTIVKTKSDIINIVLAKYPDAQGLIVNLEKEGNNSVYEVEFSTKKYSKAELKLNPVTGAIGHEELKYK